MARILLADDDSDAVEIWSRVLKRHGDTLIIAGNAADAVRLAEEERPELILMDMMMPVSSTGDVAQDAGLGAVIAIKSIPHLKDIPIIALTGHGMSMFRNRMLEAGCKDILSKPIEQFSHLTGAIDQALKK